MYMHMHMYACTCQCTCVCVASMCVRAFICVCVRACIHGHMRIRSGIKGINENEYEFLRKCAIKVLSKEKRPMSTKEIIDIGFEEYEFFGFDWQKKELEFAFSLDPKLRIAKKGSKWVVS